MLCGSTLLCGVAGFYRVGLAFNLILLVIAALTALEYATGTDLGINRLTVGYKFDFEMPYPGRMAFGTSLCFIVSGAAF